MSDAITSFTGEYRFLSNFSPPGAFGYPTVEHYFQAMKSTDRAYRELVRLAATPGEAKRRGREVKLREHWETMRLEVMRAGLADKFAFTGGQPSVVAHRLLDTGDAVLVEGNTWHDNYWGDCTCPRCAFAPTEGRNRLGRLLMERRAILREAMRDVR